MTGRSVPVGCRLTVPTHRWMVLQIVANWLLVSRWLVCVCCGLTTDGLPTGSELTLLLAEGDRCRPVMTMPPWGSSPLLLLSILPPSASSSP